MSEPPIPGEFGNMSTDLQLLGAAVMGALIGAGFLALIALAAWAAIRAS